jgi:hypothetical protein
MMGVENDKIVHIPLSKTVKLHKRIDQGLIDLAEDIATFGYLKTHTG